MLMIRRSDLDLGVNSLRLRSRLLTGMVGQFYQLAKWKFIIKNSLSRVTKEGNPPTNQFGRYVSAIFGMECSWLGQSSYAMTFT